MRIHIQKCSRSDIWSPTQKKQLRLHFQHQVHRDIQYRTRAEYSWFDIAAGKSQQGFMLYQDLAWRPFFKWKWVARYAIFDISDFDARIYAYENDVPGFFSIPAYQGRGSRYYAILNYKASKNIEIWARLSQTRIQDTRVVGTGLERISGDKRSELKLQIRWKF